MEKFGNQKNSHTSKKSPFFLFFFLSWVANTQPNHWSKWVVCTQLVVWDRRNCPGPLPIYLWLTRPFSFRKWGCFSWGVFFVRVLGEENTQQRNHPGGVLTIKAGCAHSINRAGPKQILSRASWTLPNIWPIAFRSHARDLGL